MSVCGKYSLIVFLSKYQTETKQNIAQNVHLVSTPRLSTASLSFDRTPPALNQFFELVTVEHFSLSSVPFSISSLNFFITREMNSVGTFHESCKQAEHRGCQIQV
jgi:hypothetical protein